MKKMISALKINKCLVLGVLFLSFAFSTMAQPPIAVPDGYAAGTTGGGNATPVHVSSAAAFKSAVSGNSPKVIVVNGNLNVGDVSIGSNTTLVGANSNAGLYGGRVAVNGNNYIIQNLNFGPASGDAMEISGGTKVFVTKCSFHDAGDELFSIVRAADYVTVSWCKFYFDNTHSHAFGNLIGNSDSATGDRGKLHVTMHHNWYGNGVRGRQPRVRFGYVHIYNNYYNSSSGGYCIGVGKECHIKLENTHFDNVSSPWADYGGASNGIMGWSNLLFEGCSQPTFISNSYPAFNLPYSYTLDPVANVESIVKAGAGNVVSGATVSVTGVTVSPTSTSVGVGGTTQLTATVAPSNATNKAVTWSSGNTSVATVSSAGVVTGVAAGSATITVRTTDGNKTATSAVTVTQTTDLPAGYIFVANEKQTFTYTGAVDIAYGANGKYNYLYNQSSGSCACTNAVFGDPIYGTAKSCYIKPIGSVSVSGVSVFPTSVSVTVSATTQLNATVAPSNATNKNVSWSSNNTSVATVNSSGLVTGFAAGSATITVTTQDGGKTATCLVTVTGQPQQTTVTIQENATGFSSVDGTIDNNNAGFTGTGFANTDNASGKGITWSISVPSAGTYSLVWRFANGTTSNRTGQLMVDGVTVISSVSMTGTGSWTTWTETPAVNVSLSAGTKRIRLQATNSGGLANIDYLKVTGSGLSAVACVGLKSAEDLSIGTPDLDIKLYPVPVDNLLNIELSKLPEEALTVSLIDIAGRLIMTDRIQDINYTLDMSGLSAGYYIIKISGLNVNVVENIRKE